ncbi:MAG: (Fe-S)-binding protein [Candidatus Hodarchaeota archaeon]
MVNFKKLKRYNKELLYCTLCSTCSPSCCSYKAMGWESYTPRARMMLAKHYLDGTFKDDGALSNRIFHCTMCDSCTEECPSPHDPREVIQSFRIELWKKSIVPEELKEMNSIVEKHDNPLKMAKDARNRWAEPVQQDLVESGDNLFFAGCIPAYQNSDYLQKLVKAYAKMDLPLSIIPGNAEVCCGLPVLDSGNAVLFNVLITRNITTMLEINPKRIVFACPSCFSFIKEYYGKESEEFRKIELVFYTDDIANGIKAGKLQMQGFRGPTRITYHDPCHLGRFSKLWGSPREIIKSIANAEYIELDNSKEKTACCGSGGGLMMTDPEGNKTIADWRMAEVLENDVEYLLNTCFTCQNTLQGAAFRSDDGMDLEVVHILDLLALD